MILRNKIQDIYIKLFTENFKIAKNPIIVIGNGKITNFKFN